MKNNKGITLVALIITIIILLVLAVIVIRQVTNKDIVTEAQSAREQYQAAQENEGVDLQNTVDYIRDVKQQVNGEINFTVAGDATYTTQRGTTWEEFVAENSSYGTSTDSTTGQKYVTVRKGDTIYRVYYLDHILNDRKYVLASDVIDESIGYMLQEYQSLR